VIGGGSRSRTWIAIIAAVLGIPLHRLADGEHSSAFGAARLARMAVTGEAPDASLHATRSSRDRRARRHAGRSLRKTYRPPVPDAPKNLFVGRMSQFPR